MPAMAHAVFTLFRCRIVVVCWKGLLLLLSSLHWSASTMNAAWRAMLKHDMAAIHRLSERVHPDYPEDEAVFDEKLALFPFGCLTLDSEDGRLVGYCFSHPWAKGIPP